MFNPSCRARFWILLTIYAAGCSAGGSRRPPDTGVDPAMDAWVSPDAGPRTAPIGTPCETNADCAGGPCVSVGDGRRVCSRPCSEEHGCPAGWDCATEEGVELLCRCTEVEESCDEADNDCDGSIDENVVINDPVTLDSALYESHWYAGDFVIDWREDPPAVLCGGRGWAFEGSSTWSDPNTGDLRFYSNGLQVWDAAGVLVPNGDALNGNMTATETSFFAPVPGSDLTRMFVFVNDTSSVYASILDMETGVIEPATVDRLIAANTGEAIGGVDDRSGGFWLVLLNGAMLDSYHVLDDTISPVPDHSDPLPVTVAATSRATIRFTRARDRIALATETPPGHWWAEYDAETARVASGWHEIDRLQGYSIEFSPNGNWLYFAAQEGDYGWQADLRSYDTTTWTTTVMAPGSFAGVALAPDGNIYTAPYNVSLLDRIENPDDGGTLVLGAISLGTCRVGFNLSKQLFLPTAVGCTTDNECDDDNRCTADVCALETHSCVHTCTECMPI